MAEGTPCGDSEAPVESFRAALSPGAALCLPFRAEVGPWAWRVISIGWIKSRQ